MKQEVRSVVMKVLIALSVVFAMGCDRVAPESGTVSKVAEAEVLDPGLLRSIMVGLGSDMDEISRGLWLEDLAIVGAAARAIAEHPHVSDAERMRIQGVLAADFAEFIKGDRHVHDTAVRLSGAASAGDMASTLDELANLQAGCVACHQSFRERLR